VWRPFALQRLGQEGHQRPSRLALDLPNRLMLTPTERVTGAPPGGLAVELLGHGDAPVAAADDDRAQSSLAISRPIRAIECQRIPIVQVGSVFLRPKRLRISSRKILAKSTCDHFDRSKVNESQWCVRVRLVCVQKHRSRGSGTLRRGDGQPRTVWPTIESQ